MVHFFGPLTVGRGVLQHGVVAHADLWPMRPFLSEFIQQHDSVFYDGIKHCLCGVAKNTDRIQPCSGQRRSGEEGHSGFGTVLNNWPACESPLQRCNLASSSV